ncbi:hypothetical protein GGR57DRAFT_435261 [Xylariaceae sp. FL1272]|nr:hypothetical protein GGR57DRAFT_435261 [Xylariaceae sp. FL1272]
MPKWDKNRDYYSDLELKPDASTAEIRTKYRKLALKWHPDRNPGREAEVGPKFQLIQSAHEILIDETQRQQYDNARRTIPRGPAASGVRGNPWSDAGKGFPPPPRRQPANTQPRPTSGAHRYEGFASSAPRNKPGPKDDADFRKNNAYAWDNIRPNSSRRPGQPTPPPRNQQASPATPARPPPGRAPTSATRDTKPAQSPKPHRQTAYQRQKQEAAFGNSSRKTGFTPRPSNVADEAPVTSKNYTTQRTHPYMFTELEEEVEDERVQTEQVPKPSTNKDGAPYADPFAMFRDKVSTPYHTPGGEKTNLFDDWPGINRSSSTRTPPRQSEMPGGSARPRPRSTSTLRSSSSDGGSEDSIKVNTGGSGRDFQPSKASDRYKPKPQPATAADMPPPSSNPTHKNTVPNAKAPQSNGGPSVYVGLRASGLRPPSVGFMRSPTKLPSSTAETSMPNASASQRHHDPAHRGWNRPPQLPSFPATELLHDQSREIPSPAQNWLLATTGLRFPIPSSEAPFLSTFTTLLPIELRQRHELDRLVGRQSTIKKNSSKVASEVKRNPSNLPTSPSKLSKAYADSNRSVSFSYTDTRDPQMKPFVRNSTENINTRFVDDEVSDWQFTAGSASANEASTPTKPRPQPRTRPTRRQTPLTKTGSPERMASFRDETHTTDTTQQPFSAGAQHLESHATAGGSTVQPGRTNMRQTNTTNPVNMTAGTAGLVDDDESEDWREAAQQSFNGIPITPDAMDIDTPPPPETFSEPSKVHDARKIPVEPHRPEWRAGNLNGVFLNAQQPKPSDAGIIGAKTTPATFSTQHKGSEDTEEFKTTFSEFNNVAPFNNHTPKGLKSFTDLQSTLPFKSQPSEQIPLAQGPPPKPLQLPPLPVAPRLPPTMGVEGIKPNLLSFQKYASEFYTYMEMWKMFEKRVQDDVQLQKSKFEQRRLRRGSNYLGFSEFDEDGANDYLEELDQMQAVQWKMSEATTEHRKRVVEFMEFRDRIK